MYDEDAPAEIPMDELMGQSLKQQLDENTKRAQYHRREAERSERVVAACRAALEQLSMKQPNGDFATAQMTEKY